MCAAVRDRRRDRVGEALPTCTRTASSLLLDGASVSESSSTARKAMGQTASARHRSTACFYRKAVDFYATGACRKINPVLGCEMYMARALAPTSREPHRPAIPNHLILLARNDCRLSQPSSSWSATSHLEATTTSRRIDSPAARGARRGSDLPVRVPGVASCRRRFLRGDMPRRDGGFATMPRCSVRPGYFLELQDQESRGGHGARRSR